MDAAIKYKRSLAQTVVDMYGYEVLKKHLITFEGITKTGHRINIPITEGGVVICHEINSKTTTIR